MPRNTHIDIAKGMGILLVLAGHNHLVSGDPGELFRVIYSFHMPLFFFLSGLLLKENAPIAKWVWSKAKSFLQPYFVVLLGLEFGKLVFVSIQGRVNTLDWCGLSGVFYATGKSISWTPLWYLPHVFLCASLTLLIIQQISSPMYRWLIMLSALIVGIYSLQANAYPWSIDLLPISTAFMLLGYLARHWLSALTFSWQKLGLAAACFALIHALSNETLDMNHRQYGNGWISTVLAVLGIYLCLLLAKGLASIHWLSQCLVYIGAASICLLLFHYPIQLKVFTLLSAGLLLEPWAAIWSFWAGLVLPLVIWAWLRRSPFLAYLLFSKKLAS